MPDRWANIYLLSQHSLGVGHLNRTSLIAGELANVHGFRVTHISGGPPTEIVTPYPGVNFVQLPTLVVKDLHSTDLVAEEAETTKGDVEKRRVAAITQLLNERPPSLFVTEFFPFSPHRLDGTALPVLSYIKKEYPLCRIVCSIRDIPICHGEVLVKKGVAHIESILDRYYDMLLIHGDPTVLSLSDIPKLRHLRLKCPVKYTGYVTGEDTIPSAQTKDTDGYSSP